MSNLNKAISTPLAILIVVVLATIVGGAVYLLAQPSEEPSPVENEWKTYTIRNFPCGIPGIVGYEIKYPPELKKWGWEDQTIERCPAATYHSVTFSKVEDSKTIEVLDINTKADPEQFLYESHKEEGAVPIEINGIEGLEISEERYVFSKSEALYMISTEDYLEAKELFNQILSTFRFLD